MKRTKRIRGIEVSELCFHYLGAILWCEGSYDAGNGEYRAYIKHHGTNSFSDASIRQAQIDCDLLESKLAGFCGPSPKDEATLGHGFWVDRNGGDFFAKPGLVHDLIIETFEPRKIVNDSGELVIVPATIR